MKIIFIIVLVLNALYIMYLDVKVHKLQEELQQVTEDAIKEINKLRKED